jgi:hypothetical protein
MLEEMEGVDDATTAAFEVAGSFFELAYGVEENSPSDCVRVAIDSLELLHGYVDELAGFPPFGNNDTIVDEHELIEHEIRFQDDDIGLLVNTPLRAAVEELRKRSYGRSILGECWYA